MRTELHFSSKTGAWDTPQALFDELNQEFNFDLDAAADLDGGNSKCFLSLGDALIMRWSDWGKSIFCNPPYSRSLIKWFERAVDARDHGATVVMLVFARTDTRWFHRYVYKLADEIRFIEGCVKFGDGSMPAPAPSMIVVYRPRSK